MFPQGKLGANVVIVTAHWHPMSVFPETLRLRLGRYRELARAVVITGFMQLAVQLLAFFSGIVIIRQLSPDEYAFYTIANTLIGAMNVLADSGLSSAVLAIGGERWTNRTALGSVLATGLAFRWRLGMLTVACCMPILCILLVRQGASWIGAVAIALAVMPSFLLGLTSQLLDVIPRLHQNLFPLQRIQMIANGARAVIVTAGMQLWPLAWVACLLAALPQAWLNRRLRSLASDQADIGARPDPAVHARLRVQVMRKMPEGIYYAVSGPLTVWLVTLFGTSSGVATVGALGRLAVAFMMIGSVFNAVAVPRFARIAALDTGLLKRRFWQSQLLLFAASSLPFLALWIEPHAILTVLGPNYSGYVNEALLMAASGIVSVLIAAAHGLGAARGIVPPPLLAVPYVMAGQILLIFLLPVGTVSGVILLGLLSGLASWVMLVAYVFWRLSQRPTASVQGL